MEILTSVKLLYIRFKSLVNDFVYSFGRAALLLLVEVQNHTVPVRERHRIRVNSTQKYHPLFNSAKAAILLGNLWELDPNPTVRYHKLYILLMLVSNINTAWLMKLLQFSISTSAASTRLWYVSHGIINIISSVQEIPQSNLGFNQFNSMFSSLCN